MLSEAMVIGVALLLVIGAVAYYLYQHIQSCQRNIGRIEHWIISTEAKEMLEVPPMGAMGAMGGAEEAYRPVEEQSPSYATLLETDEAAELAEAAVSQEELAQSAQPAQPAGVVEHVMAHMSDQGYSPMAQEGAATAASPAGAEDASEPFIPAPATAPYEAMTVKELRGLAKSAGMKIPEGATKAALIALLRGTAPAAPAAAASYVEIQA